MSFCLRLTISVFYIDHRILVIFPARTHPVAISSSSPDAGIKFSSIQLVGLHRSQRHLWRYSRNSHSVAKHPRLWAFDMTYPHNSKTRSHYQADTKAAVQDLWGCHATSLISFLRLSEMVSWPCAKPAYRSTWAHRIESHKHVTTLSDLTQIQFHVRAFTQWLLHAVM